MLEGLRRSAIMKMGLRDQPLLDQYQDEIFRLPLDTQLIILGPPGTGKTTTLIKRLGLKLDTAFLEDEERSLVEQTAAGLRGHGRSWLMFTPTELLKQYVKEAFNKEDIAASDLRIQTWSDFRRELARNQLGVLRTATGAGSFVLKDKLASLQPSTFERQTKWFDQFSNWQSEAFWSELRQHSGILAKDSDQTVARVGKRLVDAVDAAPGNAPVTRFFAMADISEAIGTLLERLRAETDGKIRSAFARELKKDPALLTELVRFVGTLKRYRPKSPQKRPIPSRRRDLRFGRNGPNCQPPTQSSNRSLTPSQERKFSMQRPAPEMASFAAISGAETALISEFGGHVFDIAELLRVSIAIYN